MSAIFISYRREDGAGWTGRLAAELAREFPAHEVFQDIDSIAIGEDFVDAMGRYLATCAVVIVIIGPRWLDTRDRTGARRLDDPEDWVRLEIEEGLRREGLRVVPVLVGGASMPRSTELPESIRPLGRRNAHEISDKRWSHDVSQLVAALRKIPALDTEFRDGDGCPEMVVVPPGSFTMGSPESEEWRYHEEGPQHHVTISRPFAVGKYPITFEEWDFYVAAPGHEYRPADSDWGRGRRPVVNVSWEDAQVYVKWLCAKTGKAYRLLSEAEWEYAARAGSTTRYPWGDEPLDNQANFRDSGSPWGGNQTAPVGSFPANAFGLYEMIGNVWEWMQDCWHDDYQGAPADGRPWETVPCSWRVARGGSWLSRPQFARVAFRNRCAPVVRSNYVGFRLARTL